MTVIGHIFPLQELLTQALGRIGDIGRTAGIRFEQDARSGDTHVHVQLRAERQTSVDSPARERVDHVRRLLRQTNHLLYHIEVRLTFIHYSDKCGIL